MVLALGCVTNSTSCVHVSDVTATQETGRRPWFILVHFVCGKGRGVVIVYRRISTIHHMNTHVHTPKLGAPSKVERGCASVTLQQFVSLQDNENRLFVWVGVVVE